VIDSLTFTLGALAFLIFGTSLAAFRPDWIVDHAKIVIGTTVAITLGAASLIVSFDPIGLDIKLDPSSEMLVNPDDPGEPVYKQATLGFGSDDLFVIAMETEEIFTKENLDALQRVTIEIGRLEGVRAVESLTDVLSIRYLEDEDLIEAGPFIKGAIPADAAGLADLRARALASPVYRKTVISQDAKTASINITFKELSDADFVRLDIDGSIVGILDAETTETRRFFVAGRPHVRAVAHHMMVADLIKLIPLAVIVAAVVVFFMTGSVRGTLVPLGSCLMATVWTFGSMTLIGLDLNIITLALGPMLIAVGSVYGVHVIAHYEEITPEMETPREAALETLIYTRTPTLLAGVTTSVGFGALLLGSIPATNEFGALSVLGVAAVTLLSLTFVPAVLTLLPLEQIEGSAEAIYYNRSAISRVTIGTLDGFLNWLGRIGTTYPSSTLVFWAIVTALAVSQIPRIVVNTDYLTFFPADSAVRTNFDKVSELLSGAVPIYVVFMSDEEGTFREPSTLRAIEKVQLELDELPGVSQTFSMVDLVRTANRALHDDDPAAADIPDNRPALAEAVFMLPKENLRRFATSNHSSANVVVRTAELGSASVRKLEAGIYKVIEASDLPDHLRPDITGTAIRINRSADSIAGNQMTQVGGAAFTIFLLVSLVFRSVKLGLFSMVPNICPVLLFFGMLGGGASWLSLPTSLIGSITLGMAIDGTMHYLMGYRSERAAGRGYAESAHDAVRKIGRPIGITAIMLFVGFNVMLLSGFTTLREFGYLTGIVMLICMSTDLGLFPALLVKVRL